MTNDRHAALCSLVREAVVAAAYHELHTLFHNTWSLATLEAVSSNIADQCLAQFDHAPTTLNELLAQSDLVDPRGRVNGHGIVQVIRRMAEAEEMPGRRQQATLLANVCESVFKRLDVYKEPRSD